MSGEREHLHGSVWDPAAGGDLRDGLEKAFDYRGDVTLTLKDGAAIDGYVFDRRIGPTLRDSVVRLIPRGEQGKVTIRFGDIATVAFTGRDTAAGKSWEAWAKKYREKKAAGETNIELKPEKLE